MTTGTAGVVYIYTITALI